MELLKKNIKMMYEKIRETDQLTLEEDCIVPDVLPDAERIVQKNGSIKIGEVQIDENRVIISGELLIGILYIADSDFHEVCRLETKLFFTEEKHFDVTISRENTQVCWDVDDISVSLINSRKLSIRALLAFEFRVEETEELQAVTEVKGISEVSSKKMSIELLQLRHQKKDIFRIKEEINLPSNKPNISKILWESIQLRGADVKAGDKKLEIKGELFIFVLYEGDDENAGRQWLESAVPFQGILEYEQCEQNVISKIETRLSQKNIEIQEDDDGEKRLLSAEAVLDLDIRLYEEEHVMILEDVYTPVKELSVYRKKHTYESLLAKKCLKIKVNDQIRLPANQPKLLQICSGEGEVKIDETAVTEKGILVEGAILANILYVSSDDRIPYAVLEGAVPFSKLIEIGEMPEKCSFMVQTNVEQLSVGMADSAAIEVKAGIGLQVFALEIHNGEFVSEIEERELDLKKLQEMPGIIGYIVQPEDTLWSIAKAYYTTPERICKLNHLEEKDVKPGIGIVIIKTVE